MEGSRAPGKERVLFLCIHNSACSQMAEGLLRHLAGDLFEAFSAGTEATHVRPEAERLDTFRSVRDRLRDLMCAELANGEGG